MAIKIYRKTINKYYLGIKLVLKQSCEISNLICYTTWRCIDLVSASTGEMKKDMDLFMLIKIMKVMEL